MARKNESKADRPKAKVNKKGFRKLLGIYYFMIPYRMDFIIGFACLLSSSSVLMAFPYLTGQLVDTSLGTEDWLLNTVDDIAIAFVGILLVQGILSFGRILFFARVSERAMANIRLNLFEKFMALPLAFYDKRRSGELISRITSDVSILQDTFSVTLAEFIRQLSILLIGLTILSITMPKLTVVMLATIPVLVVAGIVFGRFIRKLSKKTQDSLAEANVVVEETLQAVNIVKAFTNEWLEANRYRKALDTLIKVALHTAMYRGAFVSFIIFSLFGGIVLVMWYGAGLVQAGEITIGELTSFIIYTMFIGGSIGGLGDIYGSLQKAIGASERVLEILDEPGEASVHLADRKHIRFEGHIRYEDVCFSYPTRKEVSVLNGISFEVKAGEKVALVGPSGAGKSTIIQTLMRFYDLDKGRIFVDEQHIDDVNLTAYRENIGVVPQEVILFGGSIRENIAYGKPGASEDEIRSAAEKANALQFIESFPEGFDTLVGERGIKLSGGQKQRVAIARAILKDPAILLLDEATSSLDAESEKLVQDALDQLMENRTTIIIAHRLATIRKVDKIYVVDQGRITEAGSHEELAELENGTYKNLLKLQFDWA